MEWTATEEAFKNGQRFAQNKAIEDIIAHIPPEVWEWAQKEVLDSGNQGIWTMCLVALDKLSEIYFDYKDETGCLPV